MSTTTSTASRTTPVLAAVFAAPEGYGPSCYGATVPSSLADRATGADKASAGAVLAALVPPAGARQGEAQPSRSPPRRAHRREPRRKPLCDNRTWWATYACA
jgi:hypothetical protein